MEENRDNEQSRLRFFTDAFVLSALCGSSALESLSDIHAANRIHGSWRATHVLRGYKLVAETALYGLLERIISHPNFLNMEEDSRLRHWWTFFQGDGSTSLNAAISDESSQLGLVAARIDHVLTLLRQSVIPWERFQAAADEACEFAHLLSEVGLSCTVTTFYGNGSIPDTHSLLKASAVERLHDYIEGRELYMANHYVHREVAMRKEQSRWGTWIGSPEEAETSRDDVPRPFEMTRLPDDLGIGVLAAVEISLREFGFSIELSERADDVIPQSLTGKEALTSAREVLEHAGARHYPSMSFGLKPHQEIPAETIRALGGQPVPAKPEERLRVLLSGSTRLVGSQDYFDVRRFEVLVEGVASVLPEDSPIDVLRVVHSGHAGTTKSVSIGVGMPVPSMTISDHSAWWIFYRVYDLDGLEPANREAQKAIEDIVQRFDGRIRIEPIPEVPTKTLLSLIDKSALREENRHLRERVRKMKAMNDKLRGAIPEMLSGLLLARTGYRFVRTSHKVRFPGVGERELDAVGVRSSDAGAECLIVEAKGHHDSQYDLVEQIKRLEEKIKLARSNNQLVGQTLGCDEPLVGFRGRFISMANLNDLLEHPVGDAPWGTFSTFEQAARVPEVKEFLDELVDIEVWHFDGFQSELRQAGIAEEYVKLVERSVMTWHVGSPEQPPVEIQGSSSA